MLVEVSPRLVQLRLACDELKDMPNRVSQTLLESVDEQSTSLRNESRRIRVRLVKIARDVERVGDDASCGGIGDDGDGVISDVTAEANGGEVEPLIECCKVGKLDPFDAML